MAAPFTALTAITSFFPSQILAKQLPSLFQESEVISPVPKWHLLINTDFINKDKNDKLLNNTMN